MDMPSQKLVMLNALTHGIQARDEQEAPAMPNVGNIVFLAQQISNKDWRINELDDTPLHHIVSFGRDDAMAQVITEVTECGCPLDEENVLGETPLSLAAKFNNPTMMRTLLEYGARIREGMLKNEQLADYYSKTVQCYEQWSQTPDVRRLRATDLVSFANVGVLNQVLKPELWHDAQGHFLECLGELPDRIKQEVVVDYPRMIHLIGNPCPLISAEGASVEVSQKSGVCDRAFA